MNALRRVLRAPGLLLAFAVLHLATAFFVGRTVRSAAGASLGPFAVLSDGHLLYSTIALLAKNPEVIASFRSLLVGSGIVTLLFWTLFSAGAITRLNARLPASEVVAAAVRNLPGVVVVTLWGLLPRAVLLGVCGAAAAKASGGWKGAALLAAVAVLFYCVCAVDLARCHVVLHGARRFHPMTAVRAFLQALRRPGVLGASMLMSLGQWATVFLILFLAGKGLGTASAVWWARGLSVLGVFFALARISVAVGAGSPPVAAEQPQAEQPQADEPEAEEPPEAAEVEPIPETL